MDRATISLDELFSEDHKDSKYKELQRSKKPFSDLVVDVVNRRNELKMTQKDLAKKAGTYQSRISKIESGEHDFRLSTIINIATALDADVEIRLKPTGHSRAKEFVEVRRRSFVIDPRIATAGSVRLRVTDIFGRDVLREDEPKALSPDTGFWFLASGRGETPSTDIPVAQDDPDDYYAWPIHEYAEEKV